MVRETLVNDQKPAATSHRFFETHASINGKCITETEDEEYAATGPLGGGRPTRPLTFGNEKL